MPDSDTQIELNRIIFEELCVGKLLLQSKDFYLNTIDTLHQQGEEGVILGCTEIGLLIQQSDSHLPFFDTAILHSKMAANFILNNY